MAAIYDLREHLAPLTDAEVACLGVCLGWPDAATICARYAWWPHVRSLFTEAGGTALHPLVEIALHRAIQARLGA